MDVSITPQALVSQTLASLQQNENTLANLQEQASTGFSILQPSDNPVDAVSVLSTNAENLQLNSYLSNIQTAQDSLNTSSTALQQVSSILTQATSVATQGSNLPNDPTSMSALASQVNDMISQMLILANTKNATGQYVFSGTATGTAPYAVTATNAQGQTQTISYVGSNEPSETTIGQQQTVQTYYSGNQIFQAPQRGATVFTGTTGAAAGTGTDSATGEGTLLVSHTATSYGSGTGVQPGTSSAAGDTILGPAGTHNLTVVDSSGSGASGTVSLDGGPAVAFTNTDTNLQVTGTGGQVVYVNTTAIVPGTDSTVPITSNGTLSTDGGASSVAIDYSADQQVTNKDTGAVTNVDSTKITSTGSDDVVYTGTSDVFQTLISLRDELLNTQGLSPAQQTAAISGQLTQIQRVQNGVLQAAGEQGSGLQTLTASQSRIQAFQVNLQSVLGNLQGADVSQVVIGIQSQQNQLQLTLASASRLFSQNLLEFL